MVGRGGSRPGAGRKKGSITKKTQEIAARAIESGITPLEVIITAMRDETDIQMAKAKKDREWGKAAGYARDAAPYCHPRLSAVAHTGAGDSSIETEPVSMLELARRSAFLLVMADREKEAKELEARTIPGEAVNLTPSKIN